MTDYQQMFDLALTGEPVALSREGMLRRAEMRAALSSRVVSRRRTRRAVRVGMATVAAATLLFAFLRVPDQVQPLQDTAETPVAVESVVDFAVVRDDSSVLDRFRVEPEALSSDLWVDDDALLELLRSDNRVTGLIRTPDDVIVTGDVVDPLTE